MERKNSNENVQKTQSRNVEQASEKPTVAPMVDIFENENEYLVIADVPGIRTDDIDIRYENGTLSLKAVRESHPLKSPIAAEFGYADYLRVFTLPEDVDASKINAKLTNGVLNVQLPKVSHVQPRQIKVTAG